MLCARVLRARWVGESKTSERKERDRRDHGGEKRKRMATCSAPRPAKDYALAGCATRLDHPVQYSCFSLRKNANGDAKN